MATKTLKELFGDFIKVGKYQKVKKTDLVSGDTDYLFEGFYDQISYGDCVIPLSEYKNAGQLAKLLMENSLNKFEASNEPVYLTIEESNPLYSILPEDIKEEDYYSGATVSLNDLIPYLENSEDLFLIVDQGAITVAAVDVVNMTAKEKAAEQKRIEDRKQKLKEQLEQTQSELRLLEKLGANGS